jgi:catechol 2,3-dioxygenase-like lactoylglutathione lyase family enzyme
VLDHLAIQVDDLERAAAFYDVVFAPLGYRRTLEREGVVGAEVLHEPRVWPEHHPGYYGGFVRDPDGNNVEAVHHTF